MIEVASHLRANVTKLVQLSDERQASLADLASCSPALPGTGRTALALEI